MFAEIILPLPLYGTYTYLIPPEMEASVQVGSRVSVQFGKKKYYTGIVERLHGDAPDYEVKPVMALLDPVPAVRYPQLKLWHWISEYYLCSVGEVYKAALPTGLKPESETFITLNPDFDAPEGVRLTERQTMVVMLLEEKKKVRLSDIDKELKFRNTAQIISSMLALGVVNVDEKIVERYHARKETYVVLNADRGDEERLHALFDMVKRSRLQEKTLISWLDMSGWLNRQTEPKRVPRKQLIETAGISGSILKSMIDKGMFSLEKMVINRFNITIGREITLPVLSDAQNAALSEILTLYSGLQTVLLHGVTGSGKTEIYTHLISRALRDGNQVLFLVPEISLTTQLTDRLRAVLGDRLLVYHSRFSDSERVDIWRRMLESNEPLVVLGARSSVFLPFAHLGLVIVDEEHESSYKQYDPAPRYNARDTAMVLASMPWQAPTDAVCPSPLSPQSTARLFTTKTISTS